MTPDVVTKNKSQDGVKGVITRYIITPASTTFVEDNTSRVIVNATDIPPIGSNRRGKPAFRNAIDVMVKFTDANGNGVPCFTYTWSTTPNIGLFFEDKPCDNDSPNADNNTTPCAYYLVPDSTAVSTKKALKIKVIGKKGNKQYSSACDVTLVAPAKAKVVAYTIGNYTAPTAGNQYQASWSDTIHTYEVLDKDDIVVQSGTFDYVRESFPSKDPRQSSGYVQAEYYAWAFNYQAASHEAGVEVPRTRVNIIDDNESRSGPQHPDHLKSGLRANAPGVQDWGIKIKDTDTSTTYDVVMVKDANKLNQLNSYYSALNQPVLQFYQRWYHQDKESTCMLIIDASVGTGMTVSYLDPLHGKQAISQGTLLIP